MRLVAWNCNMALHRKWDALCALAPDVAVISECAAPEILAQKSDIPLTPQTVLWMGKNRHKGLGIFSFNGYTLAPFENFGANLHYILPAHITTPQGRGINVMGVWAQNASAGITRKRQWGPLRCALRRYHTAFSGQAALLAGDFNNNTFWDKRGWRSNHMTMVNIAREMGLFSTYHHSYSEDHGAESIPTHFWRDRTKDGPTYHIDYIFATMQMIQNQRAFEIGNFENWVGNKLSDHVPLVFDYDGGAG
ncbi:endonuclease/exonuclease/phosphatase family protein [Amylibacter marinus]|uniref:Endonuclease/exonuclease/phosphatase family protein n=1 Tax=Amylibacter marinus TaxID=1475483 RepID=A0ABQ5VSP5_9RHOB|nr:hypothetical protein [Amylibacter marinus]GLQ34448.1 endonuclease/exonuclease/phosphatase family protein [Amylibacter marinus]